MSMEKMLVKNGKVNFSCLGEDCPQPCCGPHGGMHDQLVSVFGKRFMDLPITEEKREELEGKGKEDKVYIDDKIDTSFIDLEDDGSCPFFKDDSCAIHVFEEGLVDIHDTGVPICAAYPFYIDPFVGLCVDESCPGVGKGWTDIEELEVKFQALKNAYEIYFTLVGKLIEGEIEVEAEFIKNGKINFGCLGGDCPTSCCDAYEGVDPNLLPVYEHGFSDIPISAKTKEQIDEMGEGDKVSYDDKIGMCFIDLNDDKSCPFLEDGLCSIYGLEPPICRAYPFYIDPFGGLCMDQACPGVGGDKWTDVENLKSDLLSLIKEYEIYLASLGMFEANEEVFKIKDLFR